MKARPKTDPYTAVTRAIEDAEKRTAGEIVVVVTDRSNGYGGSRAGAAALLMITIALGVWLFLPVVPPGWILAAQPLLFAVLYLVSGIPVVVRKLVPSERQDFEVDRTAKAAFVERGVHRTSDRAGVLLFVSLLEHRVCIFGDEGIHRIVGADGWAKQVRGLTLDLQQGRRIDGIVRAVSSIGALLERHFPAQPEQKNELPDRVVAVR